MGYTATLMAGILAVIFAGLGFPLAFGKVPPNCWYGYRLNRPTMENEDIWYAVNRMGGRHMVYLGFFMVLPFTVSLFFLGDEPAQSLLMAASMIVVIAATVVSAVLTYRLSLRMARDKGLP